MAHLLYIGSKYDIDLPAEFADGTVTYSSTLPSVVTVTQNGIVTALKPGLAMVKAKRNSDQVVVIELMFRVVNPIIGTDIDDEPTITRL